ncbi:MAG: TolC family protein, partial [Saprospiraceae bacterium]|nr:TolC family protein [Saprospiraceae bacterium]
ASPNHRLRPDYQLAEIGLELNRINIKRYKVAYLPTLRLFGAYQQTFQSDSKRERFWAPASYLGLRLSVPIFDGLYKKTKIQMAELAFQKSQNDIRSLERSIRLEVHNARVMYLNARRRLDSRRDNLELAERIYRTTQTKYREGVGSSLEIVQAEQALYDAQSNHLQALYDFLMAKATLDNAMVE